MQRVIFFTNIDDTTDCKGAILRSKSGAAFYATAGSFVNGTIRDLLVPKDLIGGWAIAMRQMPEIIFRGDFTDEEKEQARGRIKRVPARF